MPPASRGILTTLRFIRSYAAAGPRSRLSDLRRRRPLPLERPTLVSETKLQLKAPEQAQKEGGFKQEHEGQKQEYDRRSIFDDFFHAFRPWIGGLFFIAPPTAFFLLFLCPVEPMHITGPSMSPFLNVNSSPDLPETTDYILVQRVLLDSWFRPHLPKVDVKRGQIIVFRTPTRPESLAVKRVVGVPGDRVHPLSGYPGGDEPVVVPFNHIWVEGDANSRDKSVDSNWYGPISLNLVVGTAKILMTPWYSWKVIRPEENDYPAKKSGRIEYDAVFDAKINPDAKRLSEAFTDGKAEQELLILRKNRDLLPTFLRDPKKYAKMKRMYASACWELENQDDPEIIDTAQGIVDELETAFEAVGLARNGNPLPPALAAREEENSSQRRRLEEYLATAKGSDSSSDG
ncbi:uncharacterized protein A1O9_08829 [Exophiala aquamarina CBS 119918]|uniref:Mitochondrial inner membrane protease subunit 2 n=1 Tax=Exophiala aquamarina CBS 119918 TaxID=1182545 RepID=A0A072PI25_9EURO|nr:uncharacterized protein A1O9_08829 [Exophiala aquamarina CBS 119918]KEF55175.1 hypothetical protein A1O9_08829 [Exophiala aquamarina CBS 119918]